MPFVREVVLYIRKFFFLIDVLLKNKKKKLFEKEFCFFHNQKLQNLYINSNYNFLNKY